MAGQAGTITGEPSTELALTLLPGANPNLSALALCMSAQLAFALPPPAASNNVVINARCSLRNEAEQRVIVVNGLPVHHYCADDAVAEAYAMVFLVESGFAQQTDVARGRHTGPFLCRRTEGTVRR